MRSVTEAALIFGSRPSLTSHLSIVAEDALLVAVFVKSLACGCKHLKASCKLKACWKGNKADWKSCWRVPGWPPTRSKPSATQFQSPPRSKGVSVGMAGRRLCWKKGARSCLSTAVFFIFFYFKVTGKLSTLRQMMKVPDEPGLSPNNGLENAFLSDQFTASNPRKEHILTPWCHGCHSRCLEQQ